MNVFTSWLKWCWRLKRILPYSVGYVSDRQLTAAEYDYPSEILRTVFKVVKVDQATKQLFSCTVIVNDWQIRYSQNEFARANIGRLFAFDTLDNAKKFIYPLFAIYGDAGKRYQLWEAEAINVFPQSRMAGWDYENFWKMGINSAPSPEGTVSCEAIRLTKRRLMI